MPVGLALVRGPKHGQGRMREGHVLTLGCSELGSVFAPTARHGKDVSETGGSRRCWTEFDENGCVGEEVVSHTDRVPLGGFVIHVTRSCSGTTICIF